MKFERFEGLNVPGSWFFTLMSSGSFVYCSLVFYLGLAISISRIKTSKCTKQTSKRTKYFWAFSLWRIKRFCVSFLDDKKFRLAWRVWKVKCPWFLVPCSEINVDIENSNSLSWILNNLMGNKWLTNVNEGFEVWSLKGLKG